MKQAPVISRETNSPWIVLSGIALLSIFLAIVLVGTEHLLAKAKKQEQQESATRSLP